MRVPRYDWELPPDVPGGWSEPLDVPGSMFWRGVVIGAMVEGVAVLAVFAGLYLYW